MPAPHESKSHATPRTDADPLWWVAEYSVVWEDVEPTFRREFEDNLREQQKAQGPDNSVFGSSGSPRNVDISDAHLVPDADWTTGTSWDDARLGLRFGVGARRNYPQHSSWSDEVETILRHDWAKTYGPSLWQRIKRAVRRGFEHER